MKKILFILLILVIKLSAYEYLVMNYPSEGTGSYDKVWFTNNDGHFVIKHFRDGRYIYSNDYEYGWLRYVKHDYVYAVTKETFDNYYKNDLLFLNDLYTSNDNNRNVFLNYLYNDSNFNNLEHILYNDYEILYNSDSLAVESIVNGVWAGLYDGPDQSGYLYDEKGDLKYINGVSPSFFESSFNKLMRRFGINLQSIFIRQIFYPLLILIFACVVLRSVIRLAFQAFLIRFYDKKIGQLEKRREKIENA